MLFFFLICCFFFFFFYNSLPLKPLSHWASTCEMRLLSLFFLKKFSLYAITKFIFFKTNLFTTSPLKMSFKNKSFSCSRAVNIVDHQSKNTAINTCSKQMCLLDLPELVLECIFEKLPPEGLCNVARVCSSLRERCMSDYLWERHIKQKWGRVIGPAAYKEWQWHIISRKESNFFDQASKEKGLINYLANIWPVSIVRSNFAAASMKRKICPPIDSIMYWYLALESGKFWFPAQVYNREFWQNGHVGFMLSCYDAELCYDPKTDTFQARYPPHGRRAVAVETGVTWNRLRAPPVDTSPHDLHISDCLNELRPGDHIEIQWRRNREFPYGWWYGTVGHLETCDGNQNYCGCHESDTAVLEFNQYARGSRWRRTSINRRDHREEGNEADGFYGGIRKLDGNEEISTWKRLWPADVLE